ncbi:zinc transport system ATP-binding protein [Nitrospirillum amazonense]|uniref:Zinc transport system ATP-binding protein n=1 Tax=Nitrospirillum amazonense TaxID=28077 RepID=A0A560JVV6_9PROT|nr:metal ABC transporter ATP-binding protein [Nitrospirillum amazonense]TWB75252.1 zinc transport system ATP-binding protein [Nitrospirillum amazonense]
MPSDAEFPEMSPEAALIKTTSLTVQFGRRTVLQSVDLAVSAGEVVTLVGPNGAGKSTLLRAVLGLQRPSGGTVWRKPGLRIGYMPQRLAVDATLPLTVRRLLALWGPVTDAAVDETLSEVGAASLADSPVQALSGGETQRVMLARALLRRPDLLVLDEPAQAVDVAGQATLYALIDAIRRRHGCGVLMVSHDLSYAISGTDRLICLNGHVCCAGRPEDVRRHPDFQALFGIDPLAMPAWLSAAGPHSHGAATPGCQHTHEPGPKDRSPPKDQHPHG